MSQEQGNGHDSPHDGRKMDIDCALVMLPEIMCSGHAPSTRKSESAERLQWRASNNKSLTE